MAPPAGGGGVRVTPRVSSGGGGRARALAVAPEAPAPQAVPSPAAPPATHPRPRLVHSQPEAAVAPRSAPRPGVMPSQVPIAAALAALQGGSRPANAYPICWPVSFGPAPATVFIKTTPPDRDYQEQQQAALVRRWLRAYRDPDFIPERYHIHHVLPLFLGGVDDLTRNGMTLQRTIHLRGHAILRQQPQMAAPPPPLRPLATDIYRHPNGTMYWLAGYKESRGEICP